ncbi:MAG: hypothetical protein GX903_10275 [Spirochaetales bacterium]|nr:hypothetical protein [Spirochaetales bacterium]
MVVELKRNEEPDIVLSQIITKKYAHILRDYKEVIAIGINFDEKDKSYTAKLDTFKLEY